MGRAKVLSPCSAAPLTVIRLEFSPVRRASLSGTSLGATVSDLLYVGLTIVVFAVLLLIVKGVERIER